jgi:hypothetical protein
VDAQEAIEREFRDLVGLADPMRRGRRFEGLVRRLFEHAHLRVVTGSRAAAPRDADVFASGREDYLVEAKWRKAKADIGDIDAFRSRLARMPPAVSGVFFSISGFTTTAVSQVEASRDRPILLVDGPETERLCRGDALRPLLRHKKRALTVEARVLTSGEGPLWQRGWAPRGSSWPTADSRFEPLQPWVRGRPGQRPVLFVDELPDVDWTLSAGTGVALDLHPPIASPADLAAAFEVLYSFGWLSGSGRFRIEQPGKASWSGHGAAAFVDAITGQPDRLAGSADWHNEERAEYFDHCPGGWYTLTLRVQTNHPRISGAHLSAILSGVPTDMTPTRMLAEAFDLDDQAFFRPLTKTHAVRRHPEPAENTSLEVVALVVAAPDYFPEPDHDIWVCGVVARNPGDRVSHDARESLGGDDLIVCPLSSWHYLGEQHTYHLRTIESSATGGATVTCAVADWT